MSVTITVPQLGESVVEATVGAWRKHVGDAVSAGEVVVDLETDKVNMEVAAPEAGVLADIAHAEGDTVGVGDVLATIEAADLTPRSLSPHGKREVEATEASPELSSPVIGRSQEEASATAAPPLAGDGTQEGSTQEGSTRATPLARRIAAEHGLDLRAVHGSGPGGRISHEDVNAALAGMDASQTSQASQRTQAIPPGSNGRPPDAGGRPSTTLGASATPAAPVAPSLPSTTRGRADEQVVDRHEERVRLSRRRQTIARRLVDAQHTAAMLTTFNEVDMSAIMELRKRRRDTFKDRHGVGLGYMSFFTRAVVGALKAYPRLNAELQADEMVLKHYYDIGIAVSTDEGLVVPVVRDADRLTFAEIERQIATLAERARNRTLTLEELQGGTFTITNGGIFGSLLSTPILNGPQVGILGMHKIEERPIALNGQVVIRPMMYLAVSYDHRIVDGAESVSFLVRVKELLEDPETLLLEA